MLLLTQSNLCLNLKIKLNREMDFTVYRLKIEPKSRFLTPLRGDLLNSSMINLFSQGVVIGDFSAYMQRLSETGAEVIISDPLYSDGRCFLGNVNAVFQPSGIPENLINSVFDVDPDSLRKAYGGLNRDYYGIEPFCLPLVLDNGSLALTKDKTLISDLHKIFSRSDYMGSVLSLLVVVRSAPSITTKSEQENLVVDMISAVGNYGYGGRSSSGYGRYKVLDFSELNDKEAICVDDSLIKVNLSSIDRPIGSTHYFRNLEYHGSRTNGEITYVKQVASGGVILNCAERVYVGRNWSSDMVGRACYTQLSSLLLNAKFD